MDPRSSFEKPTSAGSQPCAPYTESDARDGLNETKARKRLAQFGFNECVEETVHPLRQFFSSHDKNDVIIEGHQWTFSIF